MKYVYDIILKKDGGITTVKSQNELTRYVRNNKADVVSYRKRRVA